MTIAIYSSFDKILTFVLLMLTTLQKYETTSHVALVNLKFSYLS